MVKIEAKRVDSKVVHVGIPVMNEQGTRGPWLDFDGTQLYRLKCAGRKSSYYARPADDQAQRVTCQRCGRER